MPSIPDSTLPPPEKEHHIMAGATWDSMFVPNPQLVFKGLYGDVIVKDYSLQNPFANWSPFDSATGLLSSDLLSGQGFMETGLLDENGVVFTPKYAVADTMAWQTRATVRKDVTQDTAESTFTCIESMRPVVQALRESVPFSQLQAVGAPGFGFKKSRTPRVSLRSILHIAVDNQLGADCYQVTLYPRAVLTKPDVKSQQAKTEQSTKLMFEPLYDQVAGFAEYTWTDGPGWRLLSALVAVSSVVATAVTGAKANLTFNPPTNGTAPYTYSVGIVPAASGATVTFGGTAAAPTAVVSGLTVGTSYAFTVTATDSTGRVSQASTTSNSVTAIT